MTTRRNLILHCTTALLIASCPMVGAMEEVHNVVIRGTNYQITELLHVRRDCISKWNALKLKRGARYHEYKRLDGGDYTLKVYDHDYDIVKDQLKGVPDHRPFDEKFPWVQKTMTTGNIVLTGLSYLKAL